MRILITEEALQTASGNWPSDNGDIAHGLRALGVTVHFAVHRDATDKARFKRRYLEYAI